MLKLKYIASTKDAQNHFPPPQRILLRKLLSGGFYLPYRFFYRLVSERVMKIAIVLADS